MADATVQVRPNGPLRVTGTFALVDGTGNKFDLGGRDVISLCRCGQSANKPFCDGTHGKVGFKSDDKARALPPPAPKPGT